MVLWLLQLFFASLVVHSASCEQVLLAGAGGARGAERPVSCSNCNSHLFNASDITYVKSPWETKNEQRNLFGRQDVTVVTFGWEYILTDTSSSVPEGDSWDAYMYPGYKARKCRCPHCLWHLGYAYELSEYSPSDHHAGHVQHFQTLALNYLQDPTELPDSTEMPTTTALPGPPDSNGTPAPTGLPGPPDSNGTPAPTGLPGPPDSNGTPAPTGLPGPPDSNGTPAPTGLPGPPDSTGTPAPTGLPGPPDSTGTPAPTGLPGGWLLCSRCSAGVGDTRDIFDKSSAAALKVEKRNLFGLTETVTVQTLAMKDGPTADVITTEKANCSHEKRPFLHPARVYADYLEMACDCPRCGRQLGWKWEYRNANSERLEGHVLQFYGLYVNDLKLHWSSLYVPKPAGNTGGGGKVALSALLFIYSILSGLYL